MAFRRSILLGSLLLYIAPSSLNAGSLIERHLATVEPVAVRVFTPEYEPIPGIPQNVLQSKLKWRIEAVLQIFGISISESSKQILEIDVRYSTHPDSKRVALLVLAHLTEPAEPMRRKPDALKEPIFVASWRWDVMHLCQRQEVMESLFDTVISIAEKFSGDVSGAKRFTDPKSVDIREYWSWPDPEDRVSIALSLGKLADFFDGLMSYFEAGFDQYDIQVLFHRAESMKSGEIAEFVFLVIFRKKMVTLQIRINVNRETGMEIILESDASLISEVRRQIKN